jgi:hypothetical protein
MPRQPPPPERGVWIVWRGRGYWLHEEGDDIYLYSANGRATPPYRLRGIGPTPAYDFGVFSTQTGKRLPGVFHRYLVQQKGPHRFPKVPRWFSPDDYRD